MRRLAALAGLVGAVVLAAGCGNRDETGGATSDRNRAQGRWVLVRLETPDVKDAKGEELFKDFRDGGGIEVEVRDNVVTVFPPPKEAEKGEPPLRATFTIDAAKATKEVELTEDDGKVGPPAPAADGKKPADPPRMKGIYRYEGLYLVLAVQANPTAGRPTEFKPSVVQRDTGEKEMVVVLHLKRK